MAALAEMAANVAHEINNPLTIIMGHMKMIRGRLEKGDHKDATLSGSLDVVDRNLGRVADIVKSMRHFCKDASNDPFEIISINDVVAQALSLCSSKMSAMGCDVVVKSSVGEDARIRSRGPQVCQAVVCLLQNAMDAVESLPAKWIELVVTAEGERVIICCTDSGNGIAKDIRAHMMEPFFTTKDVGKGAGLGLSSAKGIIENHAGTLSYDEQSDHTSFIIELPRAVSPT
jgi:C4-dicarboxylate-specific signal transduction histidine kinase